MLLPYFSPLHQPSLQQLVSANWTLSCWPYSSLICTSSSSDCLLLSDEATSGTSFPPREVKHFEGGQEGVTNEPQNYHLIICATKHLHCGLRDGHSMYPLNEGNLESVRGGMHNHTSKLHWYTPASNSAAGLPLSKLQCPLFWCLNYWCSHWQTIQFS